MSSPIERDTDRRLRDLVEVLRASAHDPNHKPDAEIARAIGEELGYTPSELDAMAQTSFSRGKRLLDAGQIEAAKEDLESAWLLNPEHVENGRAYVQVLHHLAFHEKGNAQERYQHAADAMYLSEDLMAKLPQDKELEKIWAQSRAMNDYFRPAHVEKKFRPGCMLTALFGAAFMVSLLLKQTSTAGYIVFGVAVVGLCYLAFAPATHTLREKKVRPSFMPPPPTPPPAAKPAEPAKTPANTSTAVQKAPTPKPNISQPSEGSDAMSKAPSEEMSYTPKGPMSGGH